MKKILTAAGIAAFLLAAPALAAGPVKATDVQPTAVAAPDNSVDPLKAQWDKLKVQQKEQRDALKAEQKDQRDKLRAEQKQQRDKLKLAQKEQRRKSYEKQADASDTVPTSPKKADSPSVKR
jgi:hypothetical protein